MAAEDVGQDSEQDPDPDDECEEDEHRPEDFEERIVVGSEKHGRPYRLKEKSARLASNEMRAELVRNSIFITCRRSICDTRKSRTGDWDERQTGFHLRRDLRRPRDAVADYEGLLELHAAKLVGTYDVALIVKDEDGKVHVHKHEKPTQHGAWGGIAVGAVCRDPVPAVDPGRGPGGRRGRRCRRPSAQGHLAR